MLTFISIGILVAAAAYVFWPRSRPPAMIFEDRTEEVPTLSRREARRAEVSPPPSQQVTFLKPAAKPAGALDYAIEYADVDGVVTSRNIQVIDVEGTRSATYIRAYCHMRNSERTFRADRILRATLRASGVKVDDIERHFFEMVPEDQRPDPDHDAVMGRVRPGLDLLIWIAMADREISMEEEEVLLAFVAERNGLAGQKFAEVVWNKAKATAYIESARPTFASSSGALGKITRTGREYALLKGFAERVAAAGGEASRKRMAQLFKI